MTNKPNDIATIFFIDGHQLASDQIPDNFSVDEIFSAMRNQYEAIDQLIDSFIVRCHQSGVNVDCKKGCEYCCHQPVFANIHEVLYLINYIGRNFSKEAIEGIKERALVKSGKSNAQSMKELLKMSHPCPLLENGSCSVYAARPMACRIYLSSDVNSCIKRYKLEGNASEFPALFDFILTAGRNMNEGFASRLQELNLQIAENRLEVLLYQLLSDPTLGEKWLKGEWGISSLDL